MRHIVGTKIVDLVLSVRHLLRVCRWEGDSLLHLSYIPGSKEVAQSLGVTCQASPNLSVHLSPRALRPSVQVSLALALEKGNKMNTIEIRKMSTIERLQAMEALWDSLLYEESEIESPEWHRDILEERKRKIENDKAEFISLEELKASRKS
jgi:putative addiction module component (TIGR02574 family)